MIELPTESEPVKVIEGDCRKVLRPLPDGCVDAVVTDPPYGLEFMGKAWDHGVPGVEFWQAIGRTLKPGGYMLAMGGTRTHHRLMCAIEDAGFEIRDCLSWLYGSGFPKGQGCLKPAWEPIILARKPGPKVLPLGVDECRVEVNDESYARNCSGDRGHESNRHRQSEFGMGCGKANEGGRWPANVVHDGSDEVMEAFAAFGSDKGAEGKVTVRNGDKFRHAYGAFKGSEEDAPFYADTGTAARFFYCAKASRRERDAGLEGLPEQPCGVMQDDSCRWERDGKGNKINLDTRARNHHPTVKPLALMRWLVRLIAPAGGIVLDPFAGSGTTGVAAIQEGRRALLIELDPAYAAIARRRVASAVKPGLFALAP